MRRIGGCHLLNIACFANPNPKHFNRNDITAKWHHHLPVDLNDPQHMFLMTICNHPSLATEYSLNTDILYTHRGIRHLSPVSTSNIPANCLVYFPVTRVHRTPIVLKNLPDYRRIHLAIEVYPSNFEISTMSSIFENELSHFKKLLALIQLTTQLHSLIAENILHYYRSTAKKPAELIMIDPNEDSSTHSYCGCM